MKVNLMTNGSFSINLGASEVEHFLEFKTQISNILDIGQDEFYLTQKRNGKLFKEENVAEAYEDGIDLVLHPRVLGGKGGFGSMLRAIGAQIEKTTNRDACRDLSGRRLRDINEEQRLKRWFAKQKEREEEKVAAKKRKLEKLKKFTEGPALPKIDDAEYNKQRAEMVDSVYAAVDKGFEHVTKPGTSSSATATSTSTSSDESSNGSGGVDDVTLDEASIPSSSEAAATSSSVDAQPPIKKKVFKKTMMDEDLDSSCSSSDDESNHGVAPKKARVSN